MSNQPDNLPTTAHAAQIPAKPEKKPRISKRIRHAVELLSTPECKTLKAAAAKAGLHPDYLCRELKKPQIRVFCEQFARETIGRGLLRASTRMVELVDSDSEHVSLDAARHIAAIHGIKPASDAQVSVNVDIKAGFVIDLTPQRDGSSAKQIDQVGT